MQLLIEIKRTARLIDRTLDEFGQRQMLPERQRRALEYLDRSGCSPCISDVARNLRISRQTAQRLAIALQRRGFLAFARYEDQRLVQLRVTRAGRDAMRMAGVKVADVLWTVTRGIEDHALQSAAAVLRQIQALILDPGRDYEE